MIKIGKVLSRRVKGFPRYPISVPQIPKNKGTFASKGERFMTACLENIFIAPFHKIRPDWLRNPRTKRKLELDAYNNSLKIAGEYNGMQHYVYPNFFHKTYSSFKSQVERDLIKEKICRKNRVYLIRVPYTVSCTVMQDYIYSVLIKSVRNYDWKKDL
uniref:Restriction endonuclease n=1 Tax=Pithovirus LCDPAC01 TaxID=2506600 RepID=A0A481YNI9_9VIRU|nr:MAG: restriction endonuclease [Pithovirus LCDPAC01]